MKRLIAFVAALLCAAAHGTTLNPIQLLNPSGSAAGQAIISTGASSAPAWGGVGLNGIAPIASNSVLANATGSSAAPTAFSMPLCNSVGFALGWQTASGFTCVSGFAPLASPALTGTPTAPTAAVGDNTTKIATMAAVQAHAQPYFQAYLSASQSVTAGSNTKIQFNTKNFDSGGYYDNVTNYRFTPLVSGKYLVTVQLATQGISTGANQYSTQAAYIYKNGAAVSAQQSQVFYVSTSITLSSIETTTQIVSMNGTTDYIEGFGVITGVGTTQFLSGSANSFIQAVYLGP